MIKLIVLCLLPLFFSFNFSPMTQTIDLAQGQKTTQFVVNNSSSEPIPIVIKAVTRMQKIDGKEELNPTKDISVFPPQLIVPAKGKRTIRVDWKGKNKLQSEQAYRVIAEQVPLSLDAVKDKKGGIKILLRFMTALYVRPEGVKSDVSLTKFVVGKKLKLHVQNAGNAHQYLKDVKVHFFKGEKKINLAGKELESIEGQNVLGNTTRVFVLDLPKGLDSSFKGNISFAN